MTTLTRKKSTAPKDNTAIIGMTVAVIAVLAVLGFIIVHAILAGSAGAPPSASSAVLPQGVSAYAQPTANDGAWMMSKVKLTGGSYGKLSAADQQRVWTITHGRPQYVFTHP